MWTIEQLDRGPQLLVQIEYDDEIVGSLVFWNDQHGKDRIAEWQTAIEWLNKQTLSSSSKSATPNT